MTRSPILNIKEMEADIDNHSNLGSAKIFSVLCLGNSHELNPLLVRFSNALPSPISARYPYMVSGMNVSCVSGLNVSYSVCYVICIFVHGYQYVHYSVSTRYSQISYSLSTR